MEDAVKQRVFKRWVLHTKAKGKTSTPCFMGFY